MKFGLRYCNTGRYVNPSRAIELVQAGEEAGFESAWTVEHTVVPEGYESTYPYSPDGKMAGGVNDFPLPDPLIWMAYVGAMTSKIRLATGILILPQHNPVIVAKQVASLDFMTGGRVLLGIGVGWLEEEFQALGSPFADRGRRTDEYVAVLRELWSAEKPTFHGKTVHFEGAHCQPQPVAGKIPIIVGGHSRAAARRAGRLGDGFKVHKKSGAEVATGRLAGRSVVLASGARFEPNDLPGLPSELVDVVRSTAEEYGRDPDAIEITASLPDDLDEIPRLAALGVKRVLVPVTPMAGLKTAIADPDAALGWRDTLDKYADT